MSKVVLPSDTYYTRPEGVLGGPCLHCQGSQAEHVDLTCAQVRANRQKQIRRLMERAVPDETLQPSKPEIRTSNPLVERLQTWVRHLERSGVRNSSTRERMIVDLSAAIRALKPPAHETNAVPTALVTVCKWIRDSAEPCPNMANFVAVPREFVGEISMLLDRLPSETSDWISVADQWPRPHTHVWCLNRDGRQFEGAPCYGTHAPFFTIPHGDGSPSNTAPPWIDVTHWRSLPIAPSENLQL